MDCISGVCTNTKCQAPSPTDMTKNGTETDVDCGGTQAPKCVDTSACARRDDCVSDVCTNDVCAPAVCDDLTKNGTETDVDCGGAACPRCNDLLVCNGPNDCKSGVCSAGRCQPPSPTDTVKNGTETDVDCGGAGAPKCATDKGCVAHADCVSDGCNYAGKCAPRKSCTGHYGGDTCGGGGEGGRGPATWESCCATAPASVGGVSMDKYKITSGRMRAFLERVNGNVRATVRTLRAANKVPNIPSGSTTKKTLEPEWDLYLPTAFDGCDQNGTCGTHPNGAGGFDVELSDYFFGRPSTESFAGIYSSAYRQVGGSIFRGQDQRSQGCNVGSPGTHSYWMDLATQQRYFGDIDAEFDQTVYDTKMLNCTNHVMMQAFCVWDGGRLETHAEWQAAIGASTYPWGTLPAPMGQFGRYSGVRFPTTTNALLGLPVSQSIEHANYLYSYEYPNLKTLDYIVFVNAPGRLPAGNGPRGHADLAGGHFESLSNVTWDALPRVADAWWAQPGTWEGHGYSKTSARKGDSAITKYGKLGGRCVYP